MVTRITVLSLWCLHAPGVEFSSDLMSSRVVELYGITVVFTHVVPRNYLLVVMLTTFYFKNIYLSIIILLKYHSLQQYCTSFFFFLLIMSSISFDGVYDGQLPIYLWCSHMVAGLETAIALELMEGKLKHHSCQNHAWYLCRC